MSEKEKFDAAMDRLLKVNPTVVKAAMKKEKKDRAEERIAKHSGAKTK